MTIQRIFDVKPVASKTFNPVLVATAYDSTQDGKAFTVNQECNTYLEVVVNVAFGGDDPASAQTLVFVDTTNSHVGPGDVFSERETSGKFEGNLRGIYLDGFQTRIWLQAPDSPISIHSRYGAEHISVFDQAPKGAPNESGAYTSNLTKSFNAHLGTFADQVTSGAGDTLTIGRSLSSTLLDFTFTSQSTQDYIDHRVEMTKSQGAPYSINSPWDSLNNKGGVLEKGSLFELPPLATSNSPLVSAAHFLIGSGEKIGNGKVMVVVEVVPRFPMASLVHHGGAKENEPVGHFASNSSNLNDDFHWHLTSVIDLGEMRRSI